MTEKDFSKRLQDKLSAFQPDASHRAEDWDLLNQQLDAVLPTAKKRRRLLWLPWALGAVLVVSNGLWWFNQGNNADNVRVEQRLDKLENRVSMVENKDLEVSENLKTPPNLSSKPQNTEGGQNKFQLSNLGFRRQSVAQNSSLKPQNTEGVGNRFQISDFRFQVSESTQNSSSYSQNSIITPLDLSKNKGLVTENDSQAAINNNLQNIGNQSVVTNNDAQDKQNNFQAIDFLKPVLKPLIVAENGVTPLIKAAQFTPLSKRFSFQLGLKTELITPRSTGVTSEAGYGVGVQGGVGFGKHWRVVGGLGMVYLNYTATDKNALLGSPEGLPNVVNTPNTTTQMQMNNQSCMRYELSARYALQPSWRLKPFVGVGVSGMLMSAYQMDLQVQNMQNMTVHQANIHVNPQTHRQQMYRLSTGFEVALSRRVSWGLEAYYQRLFKKTTAVAPDFMGLQAEIFYIF